MFEPSKDIKRRQVTIVLILGLGTAAEGHLHDPMARCSDISFSCELMVGVRVVVAESSVSFWSCVFTIHPLLALSLHCVRSCLFLASHLTPLFLCRLLSLSSSSRNSMPNWSGTLLFYQSFAELRHHCEIMLYSYILPVLLQMMPRRAR